MLKDELNKHIRLNGNNNEGENIEYQWPMIIKISIYNIRSTISTMPKNTKILRRKISQKE
jgi:hypothetical protein